MTVGEVVKSIPLDMVFDLLAIQLNGPRAEGKTITINAIFTDTNERYVLLVEHGVLNYTKGKQADAADATLTTSRAVLGQILQGEATWKDKLASNEAIVEGRQEKLLEFLSLLDAFNFWFNVVTP
jgi:alkyl sulfatase BDS1-like metallo-beta-lactamase superfamily hydrolase